MADLYGSLAQLYDTTDDDPRLYRLVKKITDKGQDPHKWLEAKLSGGPSPTPEARDPRQDTSYMARGPVRQLDVKSIEQGKGLPPTEDERLGIDKGLAEPGILAKGMQGAANPQQRRQFIRGVSDAATFGLAEKAGNFVDRHFGSGDFEKSAKTDAEAAPDARDYGQMLGTAIPGGTNAIGRVAGKAIGAAGMAGAKLGELAAGGGGAIVGGGLGGAIAGAATVPVVAGAAEGAKSLVRGDLREAPKNALEAGKAAATDPLSMGAGIALGGLGGIAKGIRSGDTRTGEDIRSVEEAGGRPGVFRGAKGGAFEEAPLKGRRGTTSDVGEVAREAGDKIRGGLNARMDAASQRYGEGMERIRRDDFVAEPSPRRREPASLDASAGNSLERTQVTRIAERPNWKLDGQTSRPLEGPTKGPGPGALSTDPIKAAAERLLESEELTKGARASIKSEVLDVLAEKPTMSIEKMNQFRKKLSNLAKYGEKTDAPHFKALHQEAKRIIDETELGQVNADYSQAIEASKRAHRQLGVGRGVSRTDIEDPVAGKKVARVVRRQEENTSTAGQEAKDVARFVEENPEFGRLLQSSKLMAAKGRLRLGFPENGGLYEKLGGFVGRNVEPALGGVVYPLGSAVGGTGAALVPPMINKLQQALEEQRRRDQERAQMLAP